MVCKCGFILMIYGGKIRQQIKAFREQLITAKLFGCPKCVKMIKDKINKLKEVKHDVQM